MSERSPDKAVEPPESLPSISPSAGRQPRYVRAHELERIFGFSRISAWRWEKVPDSGFPAPLRLTSRLVYYDADAIADWLVWRATLGSGEAVRKQLARPSTNKGRLKSR